MLARAPICSMCPVNCRSGMALNCTVTDCFGASRPRSVSSTRAETRSVVASGKLAIAAPGHARSPGRYGASLDPVQWSSRLMVPADGARTLICARDCSARFTSNCGLLAGLLGTFDGRLVESLIRFLFRLRLAQRLLGVRQFELALLLLQSWRRSPACWLRAWRIPPHSALSARWSCLLLRPGAPGRGPGRFRLPRISRLDWYCARSCSVLVLSNSTTTSPGFTTVPSAETLMICRSPASDGALMVTDFSAFTSPRNCIESRNSSRFTSYGRNRRRSLPQIELPPAHAASRQHENDRWPRSPCVRIES